MSQTDTLNKLHGRLDYLTFDIETMGQKREFGGDPENDLTPATQHALGRVLQQVAILADIVRDLAAEMAAGGKGG